MVRNETSSLSIHNFNSSLLKVFNVSLIFLYSQRIYFDGEVTRAIALDLYNNLNSFSLKASYEERTEEKRI